MKWFFCTRTRNEDYFSSWLRSSLASATMDYAFVSDALEGIDSDGRYCALVRRRTNDPLTLSVSVSTDRKDAVGCPVRDFVCLEAESVKDEARLAEYFSLVLRTNDAETIYDAKSPFANVFEKLYETRSLDAFEQKFSGMVKSEGEVIGNRIEFPRSDMASRVQVACDVCATVENGNSFAIVLATRSASKVIESLNLTRMPIRIFSEQTHGKSECPDFHYPPFPLNRTGVVIALVVVVIVGLLVTLISRKGSDNPNGGMISPTNTVSCSTR